MAQDHRHVLSVAGTNFLLDGAPFPFTGISFFNAIYNSAFNAGSPERRAWIAMFQSYGVNVLRVWGQWDSRRTYVDTGPDATLYEPDGGLREAALARAKEICAEADALGCVIELVLFAEESWRDGVRLSPGAMDRAVATITRELAGHRNVTFQIWNEFAEGAGDHVRAIKAIDPDRLVTNAPAASGAPLAPGRGELEGMLDYLTPHTVRSTNVAAPHWEVAPLEIAYLLARYRKPVVDDEPARNGSAEFGGPQDGSATCPYDHILQIAAVWKLGGYVVYHHDMFQTGYGTPPVPPSGIPDPEFSPYHKQVLEFLAKRDRYRPIDLPSNPSAIGDAAHLWQPSRVSVRAEGVDLMT